MRSTLKSPALALAGISALLASSCCVLPLVFALAGISGAWIVHMRALEPYTTALMALALVSLGASAWQLYRPSTASPSGAADCEDCTQPTRAMRRWFWAVLVLALVPIVVPLAAPLFY